VNARVLVSALFLGLSWFAAINIALSVLVYLTSFAVRGDVSADWRRARRLLTLRLLPAAGATLVVLALFAPAHLWLEPPDAAERIGVVPMVFAVLGFLLIARSGWRIANVAMSAARLASLPSIARSSGLTQWSEMPMFSGIALAGVFRPRVLVGSSVRQLLTPAELDVALAHETAHQRAGDNLARALMHCAPDVFGLTRAARRLERLWENESECLADARAAQGQAARGASLASALVKVARLAARTSEPPCSHAWSTFHHSLLLEARVRLLVAERSAVVSPGRSLWWMAGSVVLGIFAAWMSGVPHSLHHLTEAIIAGVG
jgi:hypothetical protein